MQNMQALPTAIPDKLEVQIFNCSKTTFLRGRKVLSSLQSLRWVKFFLQQSKPGCKSFIPRKFEESVVNPLQKLANDTPAAQEPGVCAWRY